jgi:hypothetical protein
VRRILLSLVASLALPVSSHGLGAEDQLEARLYQARSALAARIPLEELRQYFSAEAQSEFDQHFTHADLESVLGFELTSGAFHETIQGSKGCLVYAKLYPAKAEGDWTELYNFSFARIGGEWVIAASSHSISPVHTAVVSDHLCDTLGWPWRPSP